MRCLSALARNSDVFQTPLARGSAELRRVRGRYREQALLARARMLEPRGALRKRELLCSLPEYTTLLAADAKGRELLSAQRKSGGIKVVTKPADEPARSGQTEASRRLDAIFTLAKMQPNASGEYLKRGAYIE